MASTITAGNATNGLGVTSDNTGILELKTGTGAGTTALTLNASQNATLAGTLQVAGVATNMYPLVSGTAKAWNWNGLTTNKEIDFTGIPSWAQRVTVMFNGVSTSSTSNVIIQLGTGATPTYTTSGYLGTNTTQTGTAELFTSGFTVVSSQLAASVWHGNILIANVTGNTWSESATLGNSNAAGTRGSGGSIPLAAALTAIRITTVSGTDNFDAGTINIMWE